MLQEDKQILWRASAVLLGLSLPTMLLGKSIMYVLLLLGMFVGLLATKDESLRATLKLLANSRITLLALALLGSLLVGVATGIDPSYSLESWGQVCLFTFCGAILFVTLREMPGRHVEMLMKVMVIGTVSAAVISMVDAFAHEPRLSGFLHGADKATTEYRLNFMSSVLAVLLPFVWARLMIKSREGEPFAARIAMPVACFGFVAAMVCGGRAGWAGLLVATVIFLGLAGRYHGLVIHKRHWLLGIGLVVASMALYGLAFGFEFMWQRASILGEIGRGRGILSGRAEVWGQVLANILREPLFGIGVMNYRNLPGAIDLHPHNWLLQMLLEGGIISTVLFVSLMAMVMMKFIGFAKGNVYGIAAVASMSAFLVSGLANTSIFNGWWLSFLLVSCMLGWRVGWGGAELKKRRRAPQVVKSTTGF